MALKRADIIIFHQYVTPFIRIYNHFLNLMMEEKYSTETLVRLYQNLRCQTQKHSTVQPNLSYNLKAFKMCFEFQHGRIEK